MKDNRLIIHRLEKDGGEYVFIFPREMSHRPPATVSKDSGFLTRNLTMEQEILFHKVFRIKSGKYDPQYAEKRKADSAETRIKHLRKILG